MAGKIPQKFESFARVFPILGWLPCYEPEWLRADVIAGLTLWGILVPEAIAYAAMAGAPPEAGLYTLLGSLVVYAILGTTRQAASAPTSGSSIMMAAVVAPFLVTDPKELAELLVLLVLLSDSRSQVRHRCVTPSSSATPDNTRQHAEALTNFRSRTLI
jgi:sulfate permease, SulP family